MVDLFFLYLDKQDEKYTKEYNTYSDDEQTAQNKITEYDNVIQTATQTILDCETAIAEAEERILNAATEEEKLQAEQDKQTAQETKQSAEQTKSEAETNKSTAQAELQTAQSNKQTAQYALNEVDGLRLEATGLFEMYLPYVSTDKYGNFYNFKNAGGLNYQDEPLYSNWKEDYLWLPSISETGLYSQNAKGIWGGSDFIVENGTETVEEGFNYSNATLLRSGSIEGAVYISQDGTYFSTTLNPTEENITPAYAVRPAFNLNLTKIIKDLGIDAEEKNTQYVYIDEIWDSEKQNFNLENLGKLYDSITGIQNSKLNDLKTTLINNGGTFSSTDIRQVALAGSLKTENKDIIVRIGGLDWHVTYMSTNKNEEPVLTVWLNNSYQNKFSYYKDFIFNFSSARAKGSIIGISNSQGMYGSSTIRSLTLNNPGKFYFGLYEEGMKLEVDEKGYANYTQSSTHPFALFTVDDFGFTRYLSTPREMAWQENQSLSSVVQEGFSLGNEAWSDNIDENTEGYRFNETSKNFSGQEYNSVWADDYLWLPSFTEIVYFQENWEGEDPGEINQGLWELNLNQLKNYDGRTNLISITNDGDESYMVMPTAYYLRSAFSNESSDFLLSVNADGKSYNTDYDIDAGNVRPAMHINLSKLPTLSTEGLNIKTNVNFYTGESQLDKVVFALDGNDLTLNTDYTLKILLNDEEVNDIVDVGTYKLIFTGLNSYVIFENVEFTYTVEPLNLSNKAIVDVVSVPEFIEGTTTEVIPTINVYYNETLLNEGVDYDVTFSNNTSTTNKAVYEITFKGNFTGSTTGRFVIPYVDLSKKEINCSLKNTVYEYDGQVHRYEPGNIYVDDVLLIENVDYTWKYLAFGENDEILEEVPDSYFINPKTIIVLIEGKGNYINANYFIYTIKGIDISYLTITYDEGPFTYNGQAHTPEVNISFEEETLIEGEDYDIYYHNNVNAGEAYFNIVLCGIYSGSGNYYYTINPKDISNASIENIPEYSYDNNEKFISFDLIVDGVTLLGKKSSNSTSGYDYIYNYSGRIINAGNYNITCTGIENYTGTKTFTLVVNKAEVVKVNIVNMASSTPDGSSTAYYKQTEFFDYSHTSKTVFIEPYIIREGETTSFSFSVFDSDVKYKAYRNGVETTDFESVGEINFEISGFDDDNFYIPEGVTFNATYTIYPDYITSAELANGNANYIIFYNKNSNEVELTVKSNFTEVLGEENYDVLYYKYDDYNEQYLTTPTSLIESGSYKWVLVSISDNYLVRGSITGLAYIFPKLIDDVYKYYYYVDVEGNLTDASGELSNEKVYVTGGSGDYSGLPLEVEVFFGYGKKQELIRETEYTVTKDKSLLESEGKYTVSVTGVGNYYGTSTLEFYVNLYRIQAVSIELDKTYSYDFGNPIEVDPNDLQIINPDNQTNLVYGQDYTYYTGEYNNGYSTIEVDKFRNNINAGQAELYIQGIGSYVGIRKIYFTINPLNVGSYTIHNDFSIPKTEYSYIKRAINPEVSHPKLQEMTDYIVRYSNNEFVGSATIRIEGIGNFVGTTILSFEILEKSIEDEDIYFRETPPSEITYSSSTLDGLKEETALYYSTAGTYLSYLNDYLVNFYRDDEVIDKNTCDVGLVIIEIKGINGFTGVISFECVVIPKSIEDESVSHTIQETYFYQNGEDIKYVVRDGDEILEKGFHYIVDYKKEDGNVTDKAGTTGNFEFSIIGIGNYEGQLNGSFIVEKGTITEFGETDYIYTYNRKQQEVGFEVKDAFNTHINRDEYVIKYYEYDEQSGEYFEVRPETVSFTLPGKYRIAAEVNPEKDNYTGTCSANFEIRKKSLAELLSSGEINPDELFEDIEFGNAELKPDIELKFEDYGLINGVDYNIKYNNNKDKGTVDVIIEGIGNYEGSIDTSFEIIEKPIEDIETEEGKLSDLVIVKEYTGSQISLTDEDFENLIPYGDGYLVPGTDFIYEHLDEERIEMGDYLVTLTGTGNYCNSVDITLRIAAIDFADSLVVDEIANQTYIGKGITPTLIFNLDGIQIDLVEGEDYTISYENNINVGTATITITGMGYYNGVYQTTFTIIPVELTSEKINVEYLNEFVYDSKLKNPSLKIKYYPGESSFVLAKTIDFNSNVYVDVNKNNTYENGVDTLLQQYIYDANNYLIVVDGLGNYSGQIVLPVVVNKLDLTQAVYAETINVSGVDKSYVYTSQPICPQLNLYSTIDGVTIEDFEVVYGENINVLTGGSVTLKALENSNFSGEYKINFTITKASILVSVELKNKKATLYVGDKLPEIIATNDAGINGTLTYGETEKYLALGEHSYKWVFTPDDADNYNIVYGSILIKAEEKDTSNLSLLIGLIGLVAILFIIIIVIIKKKRKDKNKTKTNKIITNKPQNPIKKEENIVVDNLKTEEEKIENIENKNNDNSQNGNQ